MLPPKSFLNAEDFENLEHLAQFVTFLGSHEERFYRRLQQWRKTFQVLNEHGYFMSPTRHFCRICEALNYNDNKPKIYEKMEEFWNPVMDCRLKDKKGGVVINPGDPVF